MEGTTDATRATDAAGATDAWLVTAARGGDSAAYGELFRRYQSRIYNYAYGIAGNPEDAGDIAQDAFVRVFEALPRVTRDLNFSAYLYRTAHNLAVDTVRSRSRFAPPDALDLQAESSLRTDPERVAMVQEQQQQTWRAAFQLSENHRAILTLRELHDMSYQDIADVMDMPRTTVGVLLSRARLKFKEAFRMSSVDIDRLTEECRDMLPLLSARIDDELSDAERVRVDSHLELCAFCRLALEEMTESSRSYRALIPLLPPAALKDGVWTRLSDLLSPDQAHAATLGSGHANDAPPAGSLHGGPAGPVTRIQSAPTGAGAAAGGPAKAAARRSPWKILAVTAATLTVILLGAWLAAGAPTRSTGPDAGEPTPATTASPGGSGGLADNASGATDPATGGPETSTSFASTRPDTSVGPPPTSAPTTAPSTTATGPSGGGSPGTPPSSAPPPPSSSGDAATPAITPGQPDASATTASTEPSLPDAGDQPAGTTATPTTRAPDTQPPPTPKPTSPANGAILSSAKVKLEWSPVKDPSGVTYRVDIQSYDAKAGGYASLRSVDGVTGTSLGHVMVSSPERWRVTAIDGAGNAGVPSPWSKFAQAVVPKPPATTTTVVLY